MRQRIKIKILTGSSDVVKIATYRKELKRNHIENKDYFNSLSIKVVKYYVTCFGKRIEIPKEKAVTLDPTLVIKIEV